jgi:hypothetical protein
MTIQKALAPAARKVVNNESWDRGSRPITTPLENSGGSKMRIDRAKFHQLGAAEGPVSNSALVAYVCGVVTRERERLARAFEKNGMAKLAADIRDESLDDKVFKWAGPSGSLDAAPKSAMQLSEERGAVKAGH